jgi:ACT domain-containing protein
MCPQLDADDIARITSEVIKKLDGRQVDTSTLQEAVKSAAVREQSEPPKASTSTASQPPTEPPEPGSRIILASFGLNRPGIVAAISAVLAENLCSIEDMSQRIMQEFYTLIMIVDISRCEAEFAVLNEKLHAVEEKLGVTILVQHEDVFRYMHRV